MLTVSKLLPGGRGLAPVLLKRAATLELDWALRQKSRFEGLDSQGRHLGIFLPRGTSVRGGDVLVAEDGSLVRVLARPEPVMQVMVCAEHGTPLDLLRAAYHLGNRHVALEVQPSRLQLEPDPVLAEMLRAMHLVVTEALAPFEPESGAYAVQGHEHSHGHGHGHSHGDGPGHGSMDAHAAPAADTPGHAPGGPSAQGVARVQTPSRGLPIGIAVKASAAPHVHGPGCGHDH